jgi:hypothetical protein
MWPHPPLHPPCGYYPDENHELKICRLWRGHYRFMERSEVVNFFKNKIKFGNKKLVKFFFKGEKLVEFTIEFFFPPIFFVKK